MRHLRAQGVRVTYVRNITDVEDKILQRAQREGSTPLELSDRMAKLYQEDVRALGCAAAGRGAQGVRAHPGDRRPGREARRPRRRLRGDDAERRARRLLQRPRLPRVRQALQAQRRRDARGRPRRGLRGEARSARFRPVEGLPGARRRVGLGQPLGQGAAGLAHRVLGHVGALPGPRLRRPLRRDGPHLPPPRERDRPERGRSPRRGQLRPPLDPQRLRQRRQGEDVEVARQLRHHPRRARRATTPRRCATSSSTVHYRGPINFDVENRCAACGGLRASRDAGPRPAPPAASSARGGWSSPASSRPSGGSTTSTRRWRGSTATEGPGGVTMATSVPRELVPFTKLAARRARAGRRGARRRPQHARRPRRPRRAGQGRQRARRPRPEAQEGRRAPARRAPRRGQAGQPPSTARSSRWACSRLPPTSTGSAPRSSGSPSSGSRPSRSTPASSSAPPPARPRTSPARTPCARSSTPRGSRSPIHPRAAPGASRRRRRSRPDDASRS